MARRQGNGLDAQTLQAWLLRSTRTPLCHAVWCTMCMLTMGGAPHDVSLLFALSHIRGAGGLSKLIDVEGGAQEIRFEGGSWLISTRLADRLGARVALVGRLLVAPRRRWGGHRVRRRCGAGAASDRGDEPGQVPSGSPSSPGSRSNGCACSGG